ncbi:MAG: hypothetical protein AB7P69_23595 [Candidatus Binatia bacterium]
MKTAVSGLSASTTMPHGPLAARSALLVLQITLVNEVAPAARVRAVGALM